MIKEWHLKTSNYYKQLFWMCTFITLFLIGIYWVNAYPLSALLFLCLWGIILYYGIDYPSIRQIRNMAGIWIVYYSNGKQRDGVSLQILWSSRFAMILVLKNRFGRRYFLVIFSDQFNYADEHELRWQLFNIPF